MRDLCRQAWLENCLGNPGCWLGRKSQGGEALKAGVRSDCRVAARPLRRLAPRSRLYLQELASLNVSLSEALDLSTPGGRALAGMLAAFAHDTERDILRDRVRAC
jgi:hypothetical protein